MAQQLAIQIKNTIAEETVSDQVRKKCEHWLKTPKSKDPVNIEMDSIFFHNDKFELVVDARGYKPEEVQCMVSPDGVQVTAERKDTNHLRISTSRKYEFERKINPDQAVCTLTSEGILLVAAPWQQ